MIILVPLKHLHREFRFLLFSSVASERNSPMKALTRISLFTFKHSSITTEVNYESFLSRSSMIPREKKSTINVLPFVFAENSTIA